MFQLARQRFLAPELFVEEPPDGRLLPADDREPPLEDRLPLADDLELPPLERLVPAVDREPAERDPLTELDRGELLRPELLPTELGARVVDLPVAEVREVEVVGRL